MEKLASRKLRMSAKETMRIAENLYTKGFISYPRTETNIFPKDLDLAALVQEQSRDPNWGGNQNSLSVWCKIFDECCKLTFSGMGENFANVQLTCRSILDKNQCFIVFTWAQLWKLLAQTNLSLVNHEIKSMQIEVNC